MSTQVFLVSISSPRRVRFAAALSCAAFTAAAWGSPAAWAQGAPPPPPATPPAAAPAPPTADPTDRKDSTAAFLAGPIRKDDIIGVQVSGEPTLSGQFRVGADGMVTLPLLGAVNLAGRGTGEASTDIARQLKSKNFLRSPQVVVSIIGRTARTVFISGAMERQGRLAIGEATRLDEVLEPAGIAQTSDLSKVIITRGEKKITVNYQAYRSGNDTLEGDNDPLLQDGDKIYVRARIQVAGAIKINGEVRSPMTAPLTNDMTVVQAIQQAGGITADADRERVVVLRDGKEIPVPLKLIQEGQTSRDVVLMDKDEVFVRRLEKPKLFVVNGGVVRSSAFPLTAPVTMSDAIAMAGGLADRADKKKITLQRKTDAGAVTTRNIDLTNAQDASLAIQADDVIAVPYPPDRKEKFNIFSAIGTATGLLYLFRR